jgi:hypothetical protein
MAIFNNVVEHPSHYINHPSGIECIELTERMGFCIGNAWKYLHRAGLKYKSSIIGSFLCKIGLSSLGRKVDTYAAEKGRKEDLKKALWYIKREAKAPFYLTYRMPLICNKQTDDNFLLKLNSYSVYYNVGQAELSKYLFDGEQEHLHCAATEILKAI